jgi:drug/metabolite transporter (DMT)-like permease
MNALKTISYTSFALAAFAANSVLCRMALGTGAIDAPSFTVTRLLSGIVVLAVILRARPRANSRGGNGTWFSALMLFLYALTFSFAYLSLDTATGALILFAAVQMTMILLSMSAGNRLRMLEWLGVLISFGGFVYLVLPGVTTPSAMGFVLMTIAGIAWGVYTLRGRISAHPLADTAFNFARTAPLVIVLAPIALRHAHLSIEGLILAVLSGAVASGIGYTVWYAALPHLSSTEAAVVQLSVPVLAALGGIVFMAEVVTLRLALATALILGGILTVVLSGSRRRSSNS